MALHWSIEEITDREGRDFTFPGDRLNGGIECMIFATMFVGISRITPENWRDFAARLRAWERTLGPISSSGEPIPAEMVRRCIGLGTNASPLTAAAFRKHLAERAIREAADAVTREIEADERRRRAEVGA